ncbi:MAG: hypothetical protein PHX61_00620 [Alphaproteobacteria bacterium]|nr:hypothetical protein [Alphaproteobacteria bacterium]
MAEIDGGALSFKSVMDNDQMNTAIDETLRRVQGLSDGTVAGGQKMDAAFDNTADGIRNALGQIGTACEMHEQALQNLEAEYQRLGQQAGAAFTNGRDEEYSQIKRQQEAIKGEITVRQKLLKELRDQSNELEKMALKQEENKQKTEANANAQVSMRTRIKEVREEMMLLVDQGIDEQSEAYQRLKNELGRLIDIQGDVAQQGKILANDEQKYQGIIQGLSGLAGGFSAVTGTVSLFAGENEDLQKVMTKVQSVMAITIGLQQVAQTLNKDSAFQLVTLNGLKEWWAGIVAKATVAETAETIATTANTAAQTANATATGAATTSQAANTVATGAQATAATAGTAANIGLAGAFRLVGVAIKSIPVFGWILAGISALIGLYSYFSSKAREAKKAQEEFSKSLIEGCYKPIGTIEMLSTKYAQLGDDMAAKQKFIEQNKKAFDELGVAVNGVKDAENLLVTNKDKFIEAQIAKAKAAVYMQQTMEKVKKQMELESEVSKMSDTKTYYVAGGQFGGGYSYEGENTAKTKKKKELEELTNEIKQGYTNAATEEQNGYNLLESAGIDGVNTYKDGTVGAIEQAISTKQAALKLLTNNDEYKKGLDEITTLQKQLEGITGKKTTGGSSSTSKDPFLEKLEKQKKEYTRFQKWMNSGDDVLSKAATTEFDGLLKQGATYIDYLKKQREIILSVDVANRSKAQNQQLRTLNDQIAEETKKTVLESFNAELSEQLNNAKTTLEILNIISQKRKELANDGTDVDNGKKDTLDEAEKNAVQQQKEETDALLDEYSSYLDQRVKLHQKYLDDIALLEKRKKEAQSPEDAAQIQRTIDNRTKQYEKDKKGTGDVDYDAMVQQYATFEQKKQSIIDEYDAKRKQAQEHGNTQLVEELNKAQAKALSSLAIGEMQVNPDWEKMFGNLDEISTKKLQELLDMVEGKTAFLGVDFDPKDLETIKNKIEEVKNEIQERNPFKALISSIKDYSKATNDESKKKALTNMFESASGAIDLVSGALDAVVGGMEKMGVQMDEETQAIIGDIGGILDGASQLASGIATGNPLAIIQGGIGLLSSAFNLFNSRDRKAEKSIKRHAESLKKLQSSYEDLERVIDKALGGDRYSSQKNALENLKKQQSDYTAMADAERSKKKSDQGKIDEYEKAKKDNANQIADIISGMREELIGLDAASAAEQLGNAFIDAFAAGEDAAAAWGTKVDDIVGNIMRKMLIQKLLEQPMGAIFDKYSKKWYDEDGNFAGFDAVMGDVGNMGNEMKGLGSGFAAAIENLPDEIKKYFIGDAKDIEADTTLTGAVKGVSEETASMIGGQMNAIRINQMESTSILRQQLMHLATIANNTSYNKNLVDIRNDIRDMKNNNTSDSLRSQGLS